MVRYWVKNEEIFSALNNFLSNTNPFWRARTQMPTKAQMPFVNVCFHLDENRHLGPQQIIAIQNFLFSRE